MKKINLTDKKAVFFDCDGVVFASNEIKINAFRKALNNYPEALVEKLIEYHKIHGGISRYEKFEYFFGRLLKKNGYAKLVENALKLFSKTAVSGYNGLKPIPGLLEYIKLLPADCYKYIVSGSDEIELRKVFREKVLNHVFSGIFGSPDRKKDIIAKIIGASKYRSNNMIFFGDSKLDYEAASFNGIPFVFIYGYSDWGEGKKFFSDKDKVAVFKDWDEILRIIGND